MVRLRVLLLAAGAQLAACALGWHRRSTRWEERSLGWSRTGPGFADGSDEARGQALAASAGAALFGVIRSLMWNPHWQCFIQSPSGCSPRAQQELTAQLEAGLDFATVIELKARPFYKPPPGWDYANSDCGKDRATLLYSTEAWRPAGAPRPGCMREGGRSFVVRSFDSKRLGLRLVAVGAHFPHTYEWDRLASAIAAEMASAGTSNVLFMADTNTNRGHGDVLSTLGVNGDALGTDRHRTCCNTAGGWGYVFYFDRVVANFGTAMSTNLVFSPVPDWANQPDNEFHKGIIGDLYLY